MAEKTLFELSPAHLHILAKKMPPGFSVQQVEAAPVHQRRPEAETLKLTQGFVATVPEKRMARAKRPGSFEDTDGSVAQTDTLKKMLSIVHKLQRHPYASPFLQPVDVSEVPDYLDIVAEPIDLGTIEWKLRTGQYTSAYEFSADVRKVWSNSFKYNLQGSELYRATVELSSYFESLFRGHENLLFTNRNDAIEELYKQVEALKREIKDIKGGKTTARATEKPMTLQEKKQLGQNIRALAPQHLRGLLTIVRDSLPQNIQGQELELDLDTLPLKVCRDLERYVTQCMSVSANHKNGQQDVNAKLEDLASQPRKGSESESSSSSSSELEAPLDMDMFGSSDYIWPSYPQKLAPGEHPDVGFIMDFDRACFHN